MIKHLGLKAYGKINLGLDVLRKQSDGYHQVRMIMQTVGIYDRIDLYHTHTSGIKVQTNLFYLPENKHNLVYQAAQLLMEEFKIADGVSIRLNKFIPVSAGMAGGSSDAAAVLFGMNKMFRLGLTTHELMQRGVKIGADVPYCIMRGTALSEGIGERLTPLPPAPQCYVVIAKPGISVSTKFVYENLKVNQLKKEDHPDIDGMVKAIKNNDLYGMTEKFGNVLEQVTIPEYPVIETLKETMKELGAVNALMSGSGPTVFGIFTHSAQAEHAYEELRYGGLKTFVKQVFLTNFYHTKEAGHGKQFKC